mmetsp:Transcript_24528/g.53126  ORF Transcript_24528/g.53126 Transcript_24528/m.53126 type:complete len:1524 (-) Transcript_24528:20-4591(-)
MEDPSPKDCKNLIKLLKQIKKEQKLLEATSILENGNTEAYLSKGQALAPLTALFHKKVPVAVIERVGPLLVGYLTSGPQAVQVFFDQGSAKRSSPCAGIDRFIELMDHANEAVAVSSMKCLLVLLELAQQQENSAECVSRIISTAFQLSNSAETLENTRIQAFDVLVKFSQAFDGGIELFTENLPLLLDSCLVNETTPLRVTRASIKMLNTLAIHQPVIEKLCQPTVLSLISDVFLQEVERFIKPPKGETEQERDETTCGLEQVFTFLVWCLEHDNDYTPTSEYFNGVVTLMQDSSLRRIATRSIAHTHENHLSSLVHANAISAVLQTLCSEETSQIDVDAGEHVLHLLLETAKIQEIDITTQVVVEKILQLLTQQPLCGLRFLHALMKHDVDTWVGPCAQGGVLAELGNIIQGTQDPNVVGRIAVVSKFFFPWLADGNSVKLSLGWDEFVDLFLKLVEQTVVVTFRQPSLHPVWEMQEPLGKPDPSSRWRWRPKDISGEQQAFQAWNPDLQPDVALGLYPATPWVDQVEEKHDLRALVLQMFSAMIDANDLFLNVFQCQERRVGSFVNKILNDSVSEPVQLACLQMYQSMALMDREAILRHNIPGEEQPQQDGEEEDSFQVFYQKNATIVNAAKTIFAPMTKIVHEKSQHLVLAALETILAMCRDPTRELWDQAILIDLMCAAVLENGMLPGIIAFCNSQPEIESTARDLASYLINRGSVRQDEWKSWEEQDVAEDGTPLFEPVKKGEDPEDAVPVPIMVTKGRGKDPNNGPDRAQWVTFLNVLGLQLECFLQHAGQSAVAIAVQLEGEQNLVDSLLKAGAAADGKDPHGFSPLMRALCSGNDACVNMLLESQLVDVDAVDNDGNNVLKYAFICPPAGEVHSGDKIVGNARFVEMLLEYGVDVNISDAESGKYPLHWLTHQFTVDVIVARRHVCLCSNNYSPELLELLLNKGQAHIDNCDHLGYTALHCAIRNNRPDIAFALVHNGADPNVIDTHGNLPIHYAFLGTCSGHEERLASCLLERGHMRSVRMSTFCDEGRGKSKNERTAFRVEKLLAKGLKNIRQPPAITEKNFVVNDLLDIRNNKGWSAFDVLVAGSLDPTVITLADISTRLSQQLDKSPPLESQQDETQSFFAERVRILKWLSISYPKVVCKMVHYPTVNNLVPLSLLLQTCRKDKHVTESKQMFDMLVQAGAKFDVVSDLGLAPLHYAVLSEREDLINVLIQQGASAHPDGSAFPALLLMTALNYNESNKHVQWALKATTPTNCETQNQDLHPCLTGTPLTISCAVGRYNIMEQLLAEGSVPIDKPEQHTGKTALHLACFYGHLDCALALVENGASSTSMDNNGQVPLFACIHGNKHKLVAEFVQDGGAFAPAIFSKNTDGETPLQAAETINMNLPPGEESESSDKIVRILLDACDKLTKDKTVDNNPQGYFDWAPLNFLEPIPAEDFSYLVHNHPCYSKGVMFQRWKVAEELERIDHEKNKARAASKIQAIQRGRRTRKTQSQSNTKKTTKKKKKKKNKK